jgi:predicted metal-dependent hydrolase
MKFDPCGGGYFFIVADYDSENQLNMPYVTINDQPIAFLLRRSRKVRRLQLISRANGVEIVAPAAVSNQEALRFLWSHQAWVIKQQRHKKTQQSQQTLFQWPCEFLANETIPYRGERLRIQVKYGHHAVVAHDEHYLVVTLPWQTVKVANYQVTVTQLIRDWLYQQAQERVQRILQEHCPRLGRWPQGVQLKWQKTRWGSCGISQKIYINWLLILAPPGILEYVVVHELCHLFYRNHGKRFWEKVGSCLSDYLIYDRWLNKNGQYLQPLPREHAQ